MEMATPPLAFNPSPRGDCPYLRRNGEVQGPRGDYSESGAGAVGGARDGGGHLQLGREESVESRTTGPSSPRLHDETPRHMFRADSVLDGTQIDILGPHSRAGTPRPRGGPTPRRSWRGPEER